MNKKPTKIKKEDVMNSIYQYKNKINGHMYIGMAKDADRRYKEHENASFNKNHK